MRVVFAGCALLLGLACSGEANSSGQEAPDELPETPDEQIPDELPETPDEPQFLFEEAVLEAPETLEAPGSDEWPEHSRRLAAGREHACIIVDGRVACWGRTNQLGAAEATSAPENTATPARTAFPNRSAPRVIAGVEDAVELAAGDEHTCALSRDGRVRCWGGAPPSLVPNLSGVVQIAAGAVHTCARQTSGAVACWGDGRFGQFGQLGLDDVPEPIIIPRVDSAISLSAGGRSTCVVARGGSPDDGSPVDRDCG